MNAALHLLSAAVAVSVHTLDHDKMGSIQLRECCAIQKLLCEGPCNDRSLSYWGLATCPALEQNALQC